MYFYESMLRYDDTFIKKGSHKMQRKTHTKVKPKFESLPLPSPSNSDLILTEFIKLLVKWKIYNGDNLYMSKTSMYLTLMITICRKQSVSFAEASGRITKTITVKELWWRCTQQRGRRGAIRVSSTVSTPQALSGAHSGYRIGAASVLAQRLQNNTNTNTNTTHFISLVSLVEILVMIKTLAMLLT